MDLYKPKVYVLEDEVPREVNPGDFIGMQKNHQLRLQADWYDIQRQHENRPMLEGYLKLHACFFFKSEVTLRSKDIDFLVRYVLAISKDIVHGSKSSIGSIIAKKRLSSTNGTKFFFVEDAD